MSDDTPDPDEPDDLVERLRRERDEARRALDLAHAEARGLQTQLARAIEERDEACQLNVGLTRTVREDAAHIAALRDQIDRITEQRDVAYEAARRSGPSA